MELTVEDLHLVYAYHFNKVYNKYPSVQHKASKATLNAQIDMLQYIWEHKE